MARQVGGGREYGVDQRSAGSGEWRAGGGGMAAGGEDGFGLGVAVGLPGEHGEVVGGEAVVVESFAGEVVVDGAVG